MRPRQFDDAEVLRRAFDQFWRKGVRGTNLSDIALEAGVHRGSLYNAYGSKEALFLRAYERYAAEYLLTIGNALALGSLRERLTRFFDAAIQNFCAGSPPRGCPTTRGLMELQSVEGDGLDEGARLAFARLLDGVQALLEAAFRHGSVNGEFVGDRVMAAELILVVARGLVVLERAGHDEPRLRRLAAQTVDIVLHAQLVPVRVEVAASGS